jgi:L-lactate dehydrogenase complex protein LldG
MAERLRDYDADLIACLPHTLTEAIASQVEASGRRRLIVPENFPRAWLTSRIDYLVDRHLSVAEVGQVEGVITAAFCGIADSGTIALHHSSTEGRRLLTLLPDWHLIILRAIQVVETLPEYFDRCDQPPVLATYISGPSATSDIEMTRVKGVHGPRTLSVVLVEDEIPT